MNITTEGAAAVISMRYSDSQRRLTQPHCLTETKQQNFSFVDAYALLLCIIIR